ncbi:adenosine deaminase [Gluconacetobacter sacchari DSM 12717]|uniref:Adenosine deaminase n=1 Tax=Gluconacetobacter sacchari DSM 12717 TaxID=1307940 RepID=A0ABQ0P7U6_9PROT|nr:adenosine deaminase [Gluconacetobacter sacchari]GBQ25716.1 adenosine deaminase [Gluconacetobacter sacchari DSM 12717]
MSIDAIIRAIPKIDLHCHLAGSLSARTVIALAAKNSVPLPVTNPDKFYDFTDFYDFLSRLEVIGRCMVTRDDFARVSYEALVDGHRKGNLRYAEFFFSPNYHYPHGVCYETMVDGFVDGLRRAKEEFGITGRLIPAINRELGAEVAMAMVRDVLTHRREEVIGIGMDCAEFKGPPELFRDAYALARSAGLRCTAHACEDNQTLMQAPPRNVETCLDVLGCDRIDHGYNILADPILTCQCRERGVPFTVCSHTCVPQRMEKRAASLQAMHDAGLFLVPCTDDPPMFGTDIGTTYVTMARILSLGVEEIVAMSLRTIEAAWLSDEEKATMKVAFQAEIQALSEMDA